MHGYGPSTICISKISYATAPSFTAFFCNISFEINQIQKTLLSSGSGENLNFIPKYANLTNFYRKKKYIDFQQ